MTIDISEIRFGDIDARHEILARDPAKRRLFLDSFTVPDKAQLSDILSGEKFVVVGPKGSGKTAYLRYVHHKLNGNENSLSRFIIFRDEVTNQDREKLSNLANFRFYESAEMGGDDEQLLDCISAWQLFIHREIADLISRSSDFCAKSSDVIEYIEVLNQFFSRFRTSKFKSLLKKISRGRMKIASAGNELEIEADFIDSHGNVDVSEFVRFCNGVVRNLDFNSLLHNPRINIFFDELNLSFVSGSDFKKNAVLIRDLISACGIMNTLFSENQIPIFVYTAIRSEVVDSVESSVRELRKWVDDKAVHLNWYSQGTTYEDQPIINLLKKRIRANEESINPKFSREINLEDYFERKINGRPVVDFLIFESWARPRDLVRLLGSAAKFVPKGGKFNDESFFKAKSVYSSGSWEEKRDELNSKYAQGDIDNIKRFLTGFRTAFTMTQLEAHLTFLARNDSRVNQFVKGRVIETVLEDLYRVGVLGNLITGRSGKKFPVFQYTGLNNFSCSSTMCVHRSLWRELDLESQVQQKVSKRKPSVTR